MSFANGHVANLVSTLAGLGAWLHSSIAWQKSRSHRLSSTIDGGSASLGACISMTALEGVVFVTGAASEVFPGQTAPSALALFPRPLLESSKADISKAVLASSSVATINNPIRVLYRPFIYLFALVGSHQNNQSYLNHRGDGPITFLQLRLDLLNNPTMIVSHHPSRPVKGHVNIISMA